METDQFAEAVLRQRLNLRREEGSFGYRLHGQKTPREYRAQLYPDCRWNTGLILTRVAHVRSCDCGVDCVHQRVGSTS